MQPFDNNLANLAAMLDEDAFTIRVNLQGSHSRAGTMYVTNDASIRVGDTVVVPMQDTYITNSNELIRTHWGSELRLVIATVIHVDTGLDITAASPEASWVVAKIDLAPAVELMTRNVGLADIAAKAYSNSTRNSTRNSFFATILSHLSDADVLWLMKLLRKG